MKKLFKKIIKFIIIAIVLSAILESCFSKDDKLEPKYEIQPVEKQEDIKPQEQQTKEVIEVVQEKEPEVVEEAKEEVVDQNSIRPEFKKSMKLYEEFFDEYIEFMSSFKYEEASLSMIAKYTEFLSKYEKAMSEMDKIDESELTDAEDRLFIETQLRISNKLAQVAIDY